MPASTPLAATLLGAMCCCAPLLAAELSFSDGAAHTVAGELAIRKAVKQPDQVQLDGAPVITGDFQHSAWFVASAYPRTGAARYVLLGYDTGDNACRYLYRVLELDPARHWAMSVDFGNCEPFKDLDLPAQARERNVKSRLVGDAWTLGFAAGPSDPRTEWYSYRHGKIFRGASEVHGPDTP